MPLVNRENLDVVNTAFFGLLSKLDVQEGTWPMWAGYETGQAGTSVDVIDISGLPRAREWFGTRQVKDLRAYKRNFPIRSWEATIGARVIDINQDPHGVVNSMISPFISQNASRFYESQMYTALLANPTGVDGVSLMNASHPNVGGSGTSDNLEAAALTYALFRTAQQSLMEMKDEYGNPLNVTPSHLLVGTAQEEKAKQITGSDKVVGISDAGEIVAAGGSGVDANAVLLPNYIGGEVAVIVTPEITGNQWALMDLTKERKPFYCFEFEAVDGTAMDLPTSDNVFHLDEALYGLHARFAPVPGDWHLIHGSVTA